jgi:hypothetical protein
MTRRVRFASGAGLIGTATAALRYWSFPLILVVVWMAAVTYTVVILGRGMSPLPAGSTSVPPPMAVVRATQSPHSPSAPVTSTHG